MKSMEYEYEVYCYCTLTGIITKIGDICVPIYKKCTEARDKVHLFLAICKMCLLFLFVIKSFFENLLSMNDFWKMLMGSENQVLYDAMWTCFVFMSGSSPKP